MALCPARPAPRLPSLPADGAGSRPVATLTRPQPAAAAPEEEGPNPGAAGKWRPPAPEARDAPVCNTNRPQHGSALFPFRPCSPLGVPPHTRPPTRNGLRGPGWKGKNTRWPPWHPSGWLLPPVIKPQNHTLDLFHPFLSFPDQEEAEVFILKSQKSSLKHNKMVALPSRHGCERGTSRVVCNRL